MSDTTPPSPEHRPDLVDGLERLADRVGELTDAVNEERRTREADTARTLDQIGAMKQADRRYRQLIATLLAVVILGALATTGALTRANLVTCQNGNHSRNALRSAFSSYTDALVAASPATTRTPEEQADRNARIAGFRADIDQRLALLAPRDCSIRHALFPPQVG